ncbi:HNH endonuclease [Streptomyces sp. 900116325]
MSVPKRVRFEVLRRDSFRCRYCGASAASAPLTVDHVKPTVLGGTDAPENLVTCCEPCNSGKTSTLPDGAVDSAIAATSATTLLPQFPAVKLSVFAVVTNYGVKAALTRPTKGYESHELGWMEGLWLSAWRNDYSSREMPPDDLVKEFEVGRDEVTRLLYPIPVTYTAASWAGEDKSGNFAAYARALWDGPHIELGGLPDRAPTTQP